MIWSLLAGYVVKLQKLGSVTQISRIEKTSDWKRPVGSRGWVFLKKITVN